MNSPILLNATVSVSPGANSEISDPTRLQNPFRTPMLLDEIRFFPQTQTFSGLEVWQTLLRLALQVDLRLGRVPLTNGPVSISCFGKSLNDATRYLSLESGGPFTYKLPKPLFLLPEEYLVPRVYHNPAFGTSEAQVLEVIYVGRSLPADFPRPQVRHIPWIAQAPKLDATITTSGDTIVQTTEADLVNPFDVPLKVQRFIGDFYNSVDRAGNVGVTADVQGELTLMRAVDHEGGILVKDSTPFSHLFGYNDRSWTVNTVLAPKGFFIFFIERNYAGLSGDPVTTAPIFTMTGYRTERF